MEITGKKGESKVDWINMLIKIWRAKSPIDPACGVVSYAVEPIRVEVKPPMFIGLVNEAVL